ncbi:hypothetical protein MIZ03_3849 [Rhodoferax lithotrophicus]|uniref:Uncharacterized protein n=1 Tax=Rhodoferax lithotrophicus TaxID=2798804 RepID=A0ABN6DDB5_9BURK|nr:hypothetical protein MIZ03_3849 [Rhodoferax sp. MIZ03]
MIVKSELPHIALAITRLTVFLSDGRTWQRLAGVRIISR